MKIRPLHDRVVVRRKWVLGQQLPKVLLKREPMSPSLITAIKKGLNLSWQK